MFNSRYGLEQAVLRGVKTQTRRVIDIPQVWHGLDVHGSHRSKDKRSLVLTDSDDCILRDEAGRYGQVLPKFQFSECVAVAQSYNAIYDAMEEQYGNSKANEWWCSACDYVYNHQQNQFGLATTEGYRNKMFVKAELMPHVIEITDIKVERLQDISDEDCLREGIIKRDDLINCRMENIIRYTFEGSFENHIWKSYTTPQEAFSRLIDKVSGKGTWESNPWVFAYSFRLKD